MRHQGKVLTAVAEASAAVLCIAGCRDTTAPRDQVLVRIEVTSSVVAPNHSVNLLGIVYNPTADTVFAGAGCAPGVGFWATDPAGQVTSLYAGSVWLCDQKDSNVIAPGETLIFVVDLLELR